MDLNFFKNINNSRDDREGFFKDFANMLEKSLSRNDLRSVNGEKELSLLQEVQKEHKLITDFRDKMNVERRNILEEYAKETADKGEMYFVYSKNSQDDNKYNLTLCDEGKSNQVIEAEKSELPVGIGVDTVLRKENDKFVIDALGTEEVFKKMQEMVSRVLDEQNQFLKEQRIEGHIYEVGEVEVDRVLLFDITKDDVDGLEAVEEVEFPEELLSQVSEGIKVKFENGSYALIKNADLE